jgi:hypothetical protein
MTLARRIAIRILVMSVSTLSIGLVAGLPSALAETPPTLHVDPFRAQPILNPPASPAPRPETFAPILRSTVVAGERSLANLGGAILAIGEETHGFELVEVNAFDALFLHEGRSVRLEVVRTQPGKDY